MQAFSYLQRNFPYKKTLVTSLFFFVLVVYESFGTIYPIIPPLFGLMFLLFVESIEKKKSYLTLFVFCYLIIFEANNGFLMLSCFIFFVLSYIFLYARLRKLIKSQWGLRIFFVAFVYLGYAFFNSLLGLIFGLESITITPYLFYYIFVESLLVLIL